MILSEFIRVVDISWTDFLWFTFFLLSITAIILTGIITSVIVMARQWFIKNELPRLHNKLLEKERKKNKSLQIVNKSLLNEKKELEIKCDSLRARFILAKDNFEAGIKEVEETG